MRMRSLLTAGVAIAAIPLLAACGDTDDQNYCSQYDDLVTAADEFQEQDPLTAKVEDLRAASEEVEAELDQFQAVSEGRLDTAISTLRASVDAVRQAAVDAGSEAVETARPLLEDSLEDVAEAWAALKDIADVQCNLD